MKEKTHKADKNEEKNQSPFANAMRLECYCRLATKAKQSLENSTQLLHTTNCDSMRSGDVVKKNCRKRWSRSPKIRTLVVHALYLVSPLTSESRFPLSRLLQRHLFCRKLPPHLPRPFADVIQLLLLLIHGGVLRRRYAAACTADRIPSAKRTARGLERERLLLDADSACVRSLRRIVLSGDMDLGEEGDRPADEEVDFPLGGLSVGRSDCQSMPCCLLSCAKDSRRASRSSLDLAIFSGW